MFEKATRRKLRFTSAAGLLSTEDLWDLPLTSATGKANLDDIAKALNRRLKDAEEVSFVAPERAVGTADQLAFDVVKHIIGIRVAEREAAAQAAVVKERKQLILGIIAQKKTEALLSTDVAELEKMVAEM